MSIHTFHAKSNIGRIVFALVFFVFGLFHFMNAAAMADMMIPHWLPGGVFWVILTGAGLVAAAVSIITKIMVKLSTLLLAVMLLLFIVLLHIPGMMADPENMSYMTNLLKDSGLMGAALFMSGQFDK